MSNILERANEIVNKRSEEKDRQYGSFEECYTKASKIASILCDKEITKEDVIRILVSVKLSRESNSHKEDNLLDACAYMGALNNMLDKKDSK